MAKLTRKQIRGLARSIVLASPGGIRFTPLWKQVHQENPETSSDTIRSAVWNPNTFGQAVAYLLFSTKTYIAMPMTLTELDKARLEALCMLYGVGLVLFDLSKDTLNYSIRVRAQRFFPDMTVQLLDNREARSVSEGLELRRAVTTDASAIRDLTREAYARWVPVIGREPKPMTADYAEAVRSHRIDLLYVDGELAALIDTIREADHLLIENVAVSPAFQRRGLGRKLMAHAEQMAASQGHGEIRLYTNKLFAENVRLYSALGYRIDREEAFKGGFAVHMSKSIRPSDGMVL